MYPSFEEESLETAEQDEVSYDHPPFIDPNDRTQFIEDKYHQIVEKRKPCTDFIFLLIFILFCVGLFIIAWSAKSNPYADKYRLLYPVDYLGRTCGVDQSQIGDGFIVAPKIKECQISPSHPTCKQFVASHSLKQNLSQQKFLWYMDLSKASKYGGICVSYCPGNSPQKEDEYCPPELETMELKPSGQKICVTKRVDYESTVVFPQSIQMQVLSSFVNYSPVLYRCIPMSSTANSKSITPPANVTIEIEKESSFVREQLNSLKSITDEMIADVYISWKVILISFVVTILLGFAFVFFIQLFVDAFVWFACFSVFFVMLFVGISGLFDGYSQKQLIFIKGLFRFAPDAIFYLSLFSLIGSFVHLFIVALFFQRIKRAIAIFREASKAVASMPQLLLTPVFVFIVVVVFFSYWIDVTMSLWSAAYPVVSEESATLKSFSFNKLLFGYHLFGAFWIVQFLLAFMYTVIAGAVSTWYWHRHSAIMDNQPLLRAILRPLLYHMGSIAMGSLIVSIIQYISYIIEKSLRSFEKTTGESRLVKIFTWMVRVILVCVNTIAYHVTKHAYIQLAIYGGSFLHSSSNALALLKRNASQIALVDWIGDVILFCGQFSIAILATWIANSLSKFEWLMDRNALNYSPFLVLVIVFCMALLISKVFLLVYEVAIDTTLQCYLIDQEMSKHSGRPSFATNDYKQFMENNKTTVNTATDL